MSGWYPLIEITFYTSKNILLGLLCATGFQRETEVERLIRIQQIRIRILEEEVRLLRMASDDWIELDPYIPPDPQGLP